MQKENKIDVIISMNIYDDENVDPLSAWLELVRSSSNDRVFLHFQQWRHRWRNFLGKNVVSKMFHSIHDDDQCTNEHKNTQIANAQAAVIHHWLVYYRNRAKANS